MRVFSSGARFAVTALDAESQAKAMSAFTGTVSELLGHSFVAVTGDVHGPVADQGARFAIQRLSTAKGW